MQHNTLYTVVKVKKEDEGEELELFPFIPNAYCLLVNIK
jgi:hypothetical protein